MKNLLKLVVTATLLNFCVSNYASPDEQIWMELLNLKQDHGDKIPHVEPLMAEAQRLRTLHNQGKLSKDSDAFLSMQEMCAKYGFAYEEHHVTTSDGYMLTLGRIPGHAHEHVTEGSKPAILLMHSLANNMMQWVMNTHDTTHAFVLASNGYDVWMGNNRGSRFSQGHVHLNSKKDKQYWYFSWEEMGTHDLPAFIDYILERNKHEQISYIGHSEGTTQLLAGGSLMPEYFNKKINVAMLLAPPASMYYSLNPAMRFLNSPRMTSFGSHMAHTLGIMNPTPYNAMLATPGSKFCSLLKGQMCELLASAALGFKKSPVDRLDRADVYISQIPSDAGIYNFEHYGQLIDATEPSFKRFNYGPDGNMKVYGQSQPPHYNLKNIKFPTVLFFGTDDNLADPKDVEWLRDQIKDAVVHYEELPFNHASFQIAKDMSYFTKTGMGILNKYNKKANLQNLQAFLMGNNVWNQPSARRSLILLI